METILYLALPPAIAILWHELAHAMFALALTPGTVTLRVGFGPALGVPIGRLRLRLGPVLLGGVCTFEGAHRRGDRALIAAAGPVSSAFLAALAWNLAGQLPPHLVLVRLAQFVAMLSAATVLFTALPIRYGPSVDSDGLVVLRALWPASMWALRAPSPQRRPWRPLRLPFAIALAGVTVLGFIANFWVGLQVLLLFGFVFAGERR